MSGYNLEEETFKGAQCYFRQQRIYGEFFKKILLIGFFSQTFPRAFGLTKTSFCLSLRTV